MAGLTLIQEQVLVSLIEVTEDDRDRHVHPAKVRERLLTRRPRVVTERYVRTILRDLKGRRVDGLPIVSEQHIGRGRLGYMVLNGGIAHARDRGLR